MSGVCLLKSGLKSTVPKIGLALLSGLSLGLAAQPVGWWPLAWVGLVPLYLSIYNSSPQQALALGWLAGSSYYLILLSWLLGMHPLTWLGISFWPSLGIAFGAWLVVSIFEGLAFGIWAGVLAMTQTWAHWQRVIWAVGTWTLVQTVWSSGDLAFPWGVLAATQRDSWFLPWVQLGGAGLLSALIVGVNSWVGEAIRSTGDSRLKLVSGLLIVLSLALSWRGLSPSAGKTLKIGVIQGNIAQAERNRLGAAGVMAIYTAGYRHLALKKPDLIITPETALTMIWDERAERETPLGRSVHQHHIPLLLGAWGTQNGQVTNNLFATGGGVYTKVHLVPFGEMTPLRALIGGLIQQISPLGLEDLAAGSLEQRFISPQGIVGAGICFDSAFTDIFRAQTAGGATWLVTVTNDAWFGAALPAQRQALETLRAVENGRWLVRASNTGSSGVIDPTGQSIYLSKRDDYTTFIVPITLQTQLTPYTRWGELWLIGLGIAMSSVMLTRMR